MVEAILDFDDNPNQDDDYKSGDDELGLVVGENLQTGEKAAELLIMDQIVHS